MRNQAKQGLLLKEYPNKLVATLMQCLFGTAQSCVVAVAIERDPSRWKLGLDLSLVAVAYSVRALLSSLYSYSYWAVLGAD
jgi:hypothetical protein